MIIDQNNIKDLREFYVSECDKVRQNPSNEFTEQDAKCVLIEMTILDYEQSADSVELPDILEKDFVEFKNSK